MILYGSSVSQATAPTQLPALFIVYNVVLLVCLLFALSHLSWLTVNQCQVLHYGHGTIAGSAVYVKDDAHSQHLKAFRNKDFLTLVLELFSAVLIILAFVITCIIMNQ